MQEKTATEHQPIIPFSYESNKIRVIKDGSGEPWWIASDICRVLEIKNTSDALKHLDDDEKTTIAKSDSQPGKGPQSFTAVNEPGLYTLIIRSNKPEAKTFKRWITHEVLPKIRKTGSYQVVETLTPDQQRTVQKKISERVYSHELTGAHVGVGFRSVYRQIKDYFRVAVYRDVPSMRFKELLAFIENCTVEMSAKAIEPPMTEAVILKIVETQQAGFESFMNRFIDAAMDRIDRRSSPQLPPLPENAKGIPEVVSIYNMLDRQRIAADNMKKEVYAIANSVTAVCKAIQSK